MHQFPELMTALQRTVLVCRKHTLNGTGDSVGNSSGKTFFILHLHSVCKLETVSKKFKTWEENPRGFIHKLDLEFLTLQILVNYWKVTPIYRYTSFILCFQDWKQASSLSKLQTGLCQYRRLRRTSAETFSCGITDFSHNSLTLVTFSLLCYSYWHTCTKNWVLYSKFTDSTNAFGSLHLKYLLKQRFTI